MKLSSYIGQINQNYVQTPSGENVSLEQGLKNGMEAIYGKQSGQSITGEVLQRSGNEILLSLGQNQLLQAKLEGSMSAQPGQLLTFQIRNNSGGKVVLCPPFPHFPSCINLENFDFRTARPWHQRNTPPVPIYFYSGPESLPSHWYLPLS